MEKATNYIRKEILEQALLHPHQHAYQAGRSTETALIQLIDEIQETLNRKQTVMCAFLDIEGVFDHTPYEAVKRALYDGSGSNDITRIAETEIRQDTIALYHLI